jgi:hypothetical protein
MGGCDDADVDESSGARDSVVEVSSGRDAAMVS